MAFALLCLLGSIGSTTVLGSSGCASGEKARGQKASERSVLLETRQPLLLVLPLNVTAVMPTEVEVLRDAVWEELELYLRAGDNELKTVSRNVARRLWLKSIEEVRAGAQGARAGFDDAARALALELGKHAKFDALIIPSLFLREAVVSQRSARWDGVEHKLQFSARGIDARTLAGIPLEGVAPAASLHVAVFSAVGEKLHEALGGLEILIRVRVVGDNLLGTSTFQFTPRSDLLEDSAHIREGIATAFAPFIASPSN